MATDFKACSVDRCNKPHLARGFCAMHYKRQYAEVLGDCTIDGCPKKAFNKGGLCSAHYAKMRKYGDPLHCVRTPNGEPARFVDAAMSFKGHECLIWPFSRASGGYARATFEGRHVIVSAYICEKVHGPRPFPKAEAAHSCGNGHLGCVSPSHISWKTRKENMQDMVTHGRSLRGVRHPSSKLTTCAVRDIRNLKGRLTQKKIAERFGVHKETIGAIHRGKNWNWLD